MNTDLLSTFGAETAAKIDFLRAGAQRIDPETGLRGGVGVNRMHCRPLHPHGQRLVKAGLMRIARSGTRTSKATTLVITDAGLAELERLEKKIAKRARKDSGQRLAGGHSSPRSTRKASPRVQLSPAAVRRLRERAIAFRKTAGLSPA